MLGERRCSGDRLGEERGVLGERRCSGDRAGEPVGGANSPPFISDDSRTRRCTSVCLPKSS